MKWTANKTGILNTGCILL